jgi:hypothetical protein
MNIEQETSNLKVRYSPLDIQKHLVGTGGHNGADICP